MTLQWTIIAFILYAEIFVLLILMLPWIRPTMWKKVFNSRLVHNATREVRKYSHIDLAKDIPSRADADAVIHMRLFRMGYSQFICCSFFICKIMEIIKRDMEVKHGFIAQRNLYISGFSLLLALVIRRIVTLLARCAYLELAAEAAMKQAEGAGKAAKDLMDKSDGKETDTEKKLREEVKESNLKLKKAEADRDAMKAQSENLQEEYERVTARLREYEFLQNRKTRTLLTQEINENIFDRAKEEMTAGGDKKSD
ncbi:hypothetical protein Mgra_00003554 [Meloidogyne graminicola]|uniref:Endoplasmic reticulum transmembrane protein n=1 Tax=Meloidogyne graminicola TaxID=189291 RepID=A0A8S9ZTY9_9BILA|nr:hypothetical protein Mgra_00003554 [Meloidogyne graminicola]